MLGSSTDDTPAVDHGDGVPLRLLGGRYELGPRLGQGGSGEVFGGVDRLLGRPVAIKVFADGAGSDRVRQDQELRLLARMQHPNLVQLFDAGEENGRAFLVMRLVDGPSLAQRLRDGSLGADDAIRLGADLAAALEHVHDHGVTHRDVTPANVLLGERPMLSDFGISLLVDGTRITRSGQVIGTVAYMAPEQVRAGPVGPPADVYALGLVLIETLTGRAPFEGPFAEAAVARLTRGPDLPSGLGGRFEDLLARMTAIDPDARPTARRVAAELRALAGPGRAVDASDPTTGPTTDRNAQLGAVAGRTRPRGALLAAAAVVLVLVAGVLGWWAFSTPAGAGSPSTPTPVAVGPPVVPVDGAGPARPPVSPVAPTAAPAGRSAPVRPSAPSHHQLPPPAVAARAVPAPAPRVDRHGGGHGGDEGHGGGRGGGGGGGGGGGDG